MKPLLLLFVISLQSIILLLLMSAIISSLAAIVSVLFYPLLHVASSLFILYMLVLSCVLLVRILFTNSLVSFQRLFWVKSTSSEMSSIANSPRNLKAALILAFSILLHFLSLLFSNYIVLLICNIYLLIY